jgi:hypothetical protein
MKSTVPGLVKLKKISNPKNFLKNPIKSCCYMWSELIICRNHLSFIIGKGADVWACNPVVTCRVLRYPSLF